MTRVDEATISSGFPITDSLMIFNLRQLANAFPMPLFRRFGEYLTQYEVRKEPMKLFGRVIFLGVAKDDRGITK